MTKKEISKAAEMMIALASDGARAIPSPDPTIIARPIDPNVVDLGVKIPRRKPMMPLKLSSQEAEDMFGVRDAMKMNFVPQMLIAVALDYVSKFVNYCRDHRVSEFKKHTRLLRSCVERYADNMRVCYGEGFESYLRYINRYFDYVGYILQQMWWTVGNVACKQLPRSVDRDLATMVAVIHNLIDAAERWDKEQDRIIEAKFREMGVRKPVHRRQDPMLVLITAMCVEFEETWGLSLKSDPDIDLCVGVLRNKAKFLADEIIDEENIDIS